MSFNRAWMIALMAAAIGKMMDEVTGWGLLVAAFILHAICWVVWSYFTRDALPDAVDEGLQRYAKRWRGEQ